MGYRFGRRALPDNALPLFSQLPTHYRAGRIRTTYALPSPMPLQYRPPFAMAVPTPATCAATPQQDYLDSAYARCRVDIPTTTHGCCTVNRLAGATTYRHTTTPWYTFPHAPACHSSLPSYPSPADTSSNLPSPDPKRLPLYSRYHF